MRVFKPSRPNRVVDPLVTRAQMIRALVGLAALLWVSLAYNLFGGIGDVLDDRTEQWYLSVLLLCLVLPVFLTVMAIAAHTSVRRRLLRRMLRPLGALAALVGALVGLSLLMIVAVTASSEGESSTLRVLAVVAGTAFVLLWLAPFLWTAVVLSLVHVFRTADVHETVPPLLTTVIVWGMSLVDTLTGTYSQAPAWLQAVLICSGPLSVTGVALWELRRLRARHGITIRHGLGRQPASDT